jgi:hypothetical protein
MLKPKDVRKLDKKKLASISLLRTSHWNALCIHCKCNSIWSTTRKKPRRSRVATCCWLQTREWNVFVLYRRRRIDRSSGLVKRPAWSRSSDPVRISPRRSRTVTNLSIGCRRLCSLMVLYIYMNQLLELYIAYTRSFELLCEIVPEQTAIYTTVYIFAININNIFLKAHNFVCWNMYAENWLHGIVPVLFSSIYPI